MSDCVGLKCAPPALTGLAKGDLVRISTVLGCSSAKSMMPRRDRLELKCRSRISPLDPPPDHSGGRIFVVNGDDSMQKFVPGAALIALAVLLASAKPALAQDASNVEAPKPSITVSGVLGTDIEHRDRFRRLTDQIKRAPIASAAITPPAKIAPICCQPLIKVNRLTPIATAAVAGRLTEAAMTMPGTYSRSMAARLR